MAVDFSKYGTIVEETPKQGVLEKGKPKLGTTDFSKYGTPISEEQPTQPQLPQESLTIPQTLGKAITSLPRSGAGVIAGIAGTVAHPIESAKAIGGLALGTAEKLIPGRQEAEKYPEALVGALKERYGGIENIKRTFAEDPVGFLMDASIVLGGAGAALRGTGKVAEISQLARAGEEISRAGRAIEPVSATLGVAGRGLEKATAGRVIGGTQPTEGIIPAATRIGLTKEELPLSVLSRSPVATTMEAFAAKGIGGQRVMNRIENVFNVMNNRVDNLLAGRLTSSEIGKNLVSSAEQFKQNFFDTKKELYRQALIPSTTETLKTTIPGKETLALGGIKRIPLSAKKQFTSTQNLLGDLIAKERQALRGLGQRTSPELRTYEGLQKGLANKKLTLSDVKQTLGKIEDDLTFGTLIKTGNNAKLGLIQQVLDKEFIAALKKVRPDLASALDKADEFYQQGIQKLNSAYAQAILKNKERPDLIVESLLPKLESVEDIKAIRSIVGEANMGAIQQEALGQIFEKARGAGRETLQPLGISRQIKIFGGEEKLQALLKPEQFQALKDLEKVSVAMERGQRVLSGSQTAYIATVGVGVGATATALTALFTGNIPLFVASLVPVMGKVGFNKFLNSSLGRQLLTNGIRLSGKTGITLRGISYGAGDIAKLIRQIRAITEELPKKE